MNDIVKLNDLLNIPSNEMWNYKLHLADWNGYEHPLDVFARDFNEWKTWNEWRGNKNDFNQDFILSFIKDYHKQDKYIFGGCFRVVERYDDYLDTEIGYKVELTDFFESLIGRLVIHMDSGTSHRGRAFKLESYIDCLDFVEISPKRYEGENFPGYDNVLIDFSSLEVLVRNQKTDWKTALSNVKGIYVIVDKSNGKKYVGSAYGDSGIWSRWCSYAYSGHGGNDELYALIEKFGIEYARKNFQLSILELLPMKMDDDSVIRRESFWKDVLLTRGEFGYNKN